MTEASSLPLKRCVKITITGSNAYRDVYELYANEDHKKVAHQCSLMMDITDFIRRSMGHGEYVDEKEFMEFLSLVRSNMLDLLTNMYKIRDTVDRQLFYCAPMKNSMARVPMCFIQMQIMNEADIFEDKDDATDDSTRPDQAV